MPRAKKPTPADLRASMKKRFIRALANYLVGDEAMKSIELEMGCESAQEWSALRLETPLSGYHTVDEAEAILTAFLDPQ
jgi:hypothetical protein